MKLSKMSLVSLPVNWAYAHRMGCFEAVLALITRYAGGGFRQRVGCRDARAAADKSELLITGGSSGPEMTPDCPFEPVGDLQGVLVFAYRTDELNAQRQAVVG